MRSAEERSGGEEGQAATAGAETGSESVPVVKDTLAAVYGPSKKRIPLQCQVIRSSFCSIGALGFPQLRLHVRAFCLRQCANSVEECERIFMEIQVQGHNLGRLAQTLSDMCRWTAARKTCQRRRSTISATGSVKTTSSLVR